MAKSRAVIEGQPCSDRSVYEEGQVASGVTVTPGMLLEQTGVSDDGEKPLVQPVSTADEADPEVMVALAPDAPPKGNDADLPINHEYEAGENIQFRIFRSGDTIQNAVLAAGGDLATASEATVTYGDKVGTYSDGSVKATSTAGAALAVVDDDVDNSGAAAGEHDRVYLRVI